MPKRASVNTQKPVSKRKKSTGASATNAKPVEQIDYDLLAAAILRQTQNSSNSSMTQGSSYSVDHTNLSVCDINNTNVDDQEVSPLDVATQQRVNNTATNNPASLPPPAESKQPSDSTSSVAKLVNALLNQDEGEPATAQVRNVISLSDGIPPGAATSQRLKAKVWASQFIDLSLLLQRREEPISLSITTGSVTVQQRHSKPKAPLSIQQWTDAFLIFMGIYIEKFPDQAPHLLKYCYYIRELSKLLGDKAWSVYDENFRMLKKSTDFPWQKPVEELRIKAASTHYQLQQPFRSSTGNKPIKFCYAFNNGDQCIHNPCPCTHKCQACSGSHARVNCRVRKQKQPTNSTAKSSSSTQSASFSSQPKKFK
ncbi:uncharacterized protein LOC130049684 [Ostrea edulis]|uniref:uncharacterized protein LOC130049684 n=1 Tax=Ostrea edulis TaxID=37623 RepID=UPI0024AEED91|nr:uncharacterized protein LOC130049684 [Ostrea edulis]